MRCLPIRQHSQLIKFQFILVALKECLTNSSIVFPLIVVESGLLKLSDAHVENLMHAYQMNFTDNTKSSFLQPLSCIAGS